MRHLQYALLGLLALGAVLVGGATASTGVTQRVSVDSAGNEANGDSGFNVLYPTAISAAGRYVVFVSFASNLVPGDTNSCSAWSPSCPDVFVHDRQTGVTERVSVASSGAEANGSSRWPAISADGRYIAFASLATNLVANDTNGVLDIFVHDRQTSTTERVSVDSNGNEADGGSMGPDISADGRHVAFHSSASNLVSDDTNGKADVFLHDRQTGLTERVSVNSSGGEANGTSLFPAMSGDVRYITFHSDATDLVTADNNAARDVFVHDRQTGVTERVSVDSSGGEADDESLFPSISAGARFVAFESQAGNLVSNDSGDCEIPSSPQTCIDVFVHDRQTGTTERVSVDSGGNQGNGHSQALGRAMSADGRFVAFHSSASNLVAGDTNGGSDVFVHDRQTGVTVRVSVDSAGSEGNSHSLFPAISTDGRFVAFASDASNLVAGDTNGATDVFVHDRGPPTPTPPPDSDGDGYWDKDETDKGSDPLDAGSTPEHCDGVDNDGDTTVDEAPAGSGRSTPDPLCDPAADPDGDTILNSADLDDDDDGWSDVDEQLLSTDELDDCPNNTGHDAWAPDFDKNTVANIIDVLFFGAVFSSGVYDRRFDLRVNGTINIIDVMMFGAVIGQDCDGP